MTKMPRPSAKPLRRSHRSRKHCASSGLARDAALYRNATGTPSNSGWTAEIAYLPFMRGGPSFWPWLNARIGLQYTFNDQNPHNNTLLLYSLILF